MFLVLPLCRSHCVSLHLFKTVSSLFLSPLSFFLSPSSFSFLSLTPPSPLSHPRYLSLYIYILLSPSLTLALPLSPLSFFLSPPSFLSLTPPSPLSHPRYIYIYISFSLLSHSIPLSLLSFFSLLPLSSLSLPLPLSLILGIYIYIYPSLSFSSSLSLYPSLSRYLTGYLSNMSILSSFSLFPVSLISSVLPIAQTITIHNMYRIGPIMSLLFP